MKLINDNYKNDIEAFHRSIANLAQRALHYEVLLTPKPGLVDRNNNGSHEDMDIFTFVNSNLALGEYFYKCTKVGYEYEGTNYREILSVIRPLGVLAEFDMFFATKGVNTHKGAIFIFGILCAAVGSVYRENNSLEYNKICDRGGDISAGITGDFNVDLRKKDKLTYGESQYLEHGYLGIRGEAEAGFPSLRGVALDSYKIAIKEGFSKEIAMGEALLNLMSFVFDSNIVGRGGIAGLGFVQEKAKTAISLGGYKTEIGLDFIYEMDVEFIKNNLSPGGCADLCAAISFLLFVCSL